MKSVLSFLLMMLLTSCYFTTPAPHYHVYKSENDGMEIGVLCTPNTKVYHFSYIKSAKIEAYSKTFKEQSFSSFQLDDFFDKEEFMKSIKINDRKFHKLFKIDTLKIRINNSNQIINLLPIK